MILELKAGNGTIYLDNTQRHTRLLIAQLVDEVDGQLRESVDALDRIRENESFHFGKLVAERTEQRAAFAEALKKTGINLTTAMNIIDGNDPMFHRAEAKEA